MKKKSIKLGEIENFILAAGSDDLPTFGGTYEGGCHCQQLYDEISPCIAYLLESGKEIKRYLEIGVAAGGTTYVLNHFFEFEKIVLIDDNKHHKSHLRSTILRNIQVCELIGRSGEQRIIDAAAARSPYDLILIDGDHRYEQVDQDSMNYFSMLNKNGYLIFHDSAIKGWGVKRVVSELKNDKSVKFINEYASKGNKVEACGLALFEKVI
jgi:predicted O-methyltransferase YrrM